MAAEPLPPESQDMESADLETLAEELYRTRRPRRLRARSAGDLVVLTVPDYQEMAEALAVAEGLLRGHADVAAGRTLSTEQADSLLRQHIAAAVKGKSGPGTD
jgi:hypothetical protein